jgi:hypothetical protein
VCDAAAVAHYHVKIKAPVAVALPTVTALADADGVDLVSSEPPSSIGDHLVELDVTVEGRLAAVTDAIADIAAGLPSDATISIDPG